MLVHICCAPIWRPENSVNIWNLLWLSKRVREAWRFPYETSSLRQTQADEVHGVCIQADGPITGGLTTEVLRYIFLCPVTDKPI